MSETHELFSAQRIVRACFFIALAFVAWVVLGFLMIFWNLRQNSIAKDAILPALRDQFPAIQLDAGFGYEKSVVFVSVRRVSDPETMEKIRAFIEQVKQERGITRRVELRFWDDENNEICVFEI